jgi:hypothetical protein
VITWYKPPSISILGFRAIEGNSTGETRFCKIHRNYAGLTLFFQGGSTTPNTSQTSYSDDENEPIKADPTYGTADRYVVYRTYSSPTTGEKTARPRPKAKFGLDRFRWCLSEYYGTELGLEEGRSQPFDKNRLDGFFGVSKTPFTIVFDNSKTTAQITKAQKQRAVGYSPPHGWTVFIANDQNSINDVATRVHETGNKIYQRLMQSAGMEQPVR